MLRKCRITVLKTTFDPELSAEYGADGFGPCPKFRPGQTFMTDYQRPDGFCEEAWNAMHQYAFALAHYGGDRLFFNNKWIRQPGVAVCSCNDGLRPVIFKIEAVNADA